ncbi:MAG: FAA hydrolase family protein [Marinilabiliales bacterium]|nr:MAG: FAA hydrolase family protein [Marinilabiliales bacterium]
MKIASVHTGGKGQAAIIYPEGALTVSAITAHTGSSWKTNLLQIIKSGQLDDIVSWFIKDKGKTAARLHDKIIPFADIRYLPLYRKPSKIIGVGLNYPDHIVNLSEKQPEHFPGTFMKPDTSVIGYGDTISIPGMSDRTTAEAELGIIIGRKAKNVPRENWSDVVAGFTCIVDVTAEDILVLNPRFLTLAKGFDSFFSFGPFLVTPDEVLPLGSQRISTVLNGNVVAENIVSNMVFPPDQLVSVYSSVFTLMPGDIISTGTPGAAVINDGDAVEAKIDGFSALKNYVVDEKKR